MRKFFGMCVGTMMLIFSSCANDPCIVGNWTWDDTPLICPTQITFYSGGTGQLLVTDCASQCQSNGTDNKTRYTFTWTIVSDTNFTVTFSNQGKKCNENYTFIGFENLGSFTGTIDCNDETMILRTPNEELEFTRI